MKKSAGKNEEEKMIRLTWEASLSRQLLRLPQAPPGQPQRQADSNTLSPEYVGLFSLTHAFLSRCTHTHTCTHTMYVCVMTSTSGVF